MRDFNKDRYFQDWLRKQEEEKKLKEERRRKRIIQENRERRKRHQMMMQEQLMAQMAAFNDAVVNASGGGSGGGDTDVSAFLTATGISDSTIETALTTFVTTLKTESLWDKMVAIYPLVTDKTDTVDIQGQFKYNLKDPQDSDAAYRLTFIGSVVVSQDGLTTVGGAARYIKTHIPSVGTFTDDRPAMGWTNLTYTDTRYGPLGAITTSDVFSYTYYINIFPLAAGYRFRYDSSSYSYSGPTGYNSTGTHIFSRLNASSVYLLAPGGNATASVTAEGLASVNFTIGQALSTNDGITQNTISHAFFSNSLTADECATLQTAINTLQSDLGRT
jgi:hypothetical protein